MAGWNPWHGCTKLSEGCLNCYVYRIDAKHGRDSSIVAKNSDFYAPIERRRSGEYRIPGGETVYTCFSSDFFHEAADGWRGEAWRMMRERSDLNFFFITKRILRFYECIPPDWGRGYPNVSIACTAENSLRAAQRLPVYISAPIVQKSLACEPLLEYIDLSPYLSSGSVTRVVAGGESGEQARPCDYRWILALRDCCREFGVQFYFKQTGARFIKDGRLYRIPRSEQHQQARLAGIDLGPGGRPSQKIDLFNV